MKIAIIGAGAVGSAAAYYLSQESSVEISVFDEGKGQATKAAAGIICPWFSKRRNKAWYRLARLGADFYPTLISDVSQSGGNTSFYQKTGVFLLKKDEEKLQGLYELGKQRQCESPLIGDLKVLTKQEANVLFPNLAGFSKLLYASGGARVDGQELTTSLLSASRAKIIQKKVTFTPLDEGGYWIDNQKFDAVILAVGAWLGQLLEPLGFDIDIHPQKGQLRDYYFDSLQTDTYPVIMPEGEIDIIPFCKGKISLGASHENDKGFDLQIDEDILKGFENQAADYFSLWSQSDRYRDRVGIRAYTQDFSPFFGPVPELDTVYTASGLGSTGLTIGPLLGQQLAKLVLGQASDFDLADYPVERYVRAISK